MKVDNWILTKSLGKGAFAEVFLTMKEGNKEYYATKKLNRAFSEQPSNLKRLMNEILILKSINHPNIVKLIDLKKTKTDLYIVTEYCNGGNLYDCLNKYMYKYYMPFPVEIIQHILRQVVKALHYLHKNKIIHRDLKLENILLHYPTEKDKNSLNIMSSTAKLIDFGFATKLRASHGNLAYTLLGTPTNMEPHLLKNLQKDESNYNGYDEKVDIWSLGALCYELLVGHSAFEGNTIDELYNKVNVGNYKIPLNASKEIVSFINGMLQNDPKKRLSTEELLKHDFLVKNPKNFEKIDSSKIKNKISQNEININFKQNQSIWAEFNQNKNQQNKKDYHYVNNEYYKIKNENLNNFYQNNQVKH